MAHFQAESKCLRSRRAAEVRSSPKVCKLETQEALFSFMSEGRKSPMLKVFRQELSLFTYFVVF
jgi:hypothetical protein